MLHTLSQDGDLADKVKVIVNRVGSDDGGEITLAKAEETIGRSVYWQIPNDFKAVVGSRNAGVPLLSHAPKSKAQIAILALANALVGKGVAEAPKRERRSFFSFK
jgi:pilus assembly protein CpaE